MGREKRQPLMARHQWAETVELTKDERTERGVSVSWQRGRAGSDLGRSGSRLVAGHGARDLRRGGLAWACGVWRCSVSRRLGFLGCAPGRGMAWGRAAAVGSAPSRGRCTARRRSVWHVRARGSLRRARRGCSAVCAGPRLVARGAGAWSGRASSVLAAGGACGMRGWRGRGKARGEGEMGRGSGG